MNDEHLRERLKEKERQVGALMKRVEEQREEIIAIEKNYDSLWDSATALEEEEMPHWIPVTERLPEDAALVLIYPVDDEAASAQYWQQSNHFRMWDYCVKPGDVTHWMPLPAPPRSYIMCAQIEGQSERKI